MFYDTNFMSSRRLGKVWRAGNNIFDHSQEDEIDIPTICRKLDSWIGSVQEEAEKRLSLRTSSVMIDGAARLYKRKLEQLYDDVQTLENKILFRKRVRISNGDCGASIEDSETSTIGVSEGKSNVTTSNPNETTESKEESDDSDTRTSAMSPNDVQLDEVTTPTSSDSNKTNNSNTSRSSQCLIREITKEPTENSSKQDKEVQVNFQRVTRRHGNGFEENLPFGFVVIYENYRARIPNKIMFSSLNIDVNKFM